MIPFLLGGSSIDLNLAAFLAFAIITTIVVAAFLLTLACIILREQPTILRDFFSVMSKVLDVIKTLMRRGL